MITQEEIKTAARKYEDFRDHDSETTALEKSGKYHGFNAGVEWAIEKLQDELESKIAHSLAEEFNAKIRQDKNIDKAVEKVDRFEVIDHSKDFKGRCYVKHDCSIELSLQDGNKTLKVFVNDKLR